MSLDIRKLQTLYRDDALARAIFDTLAEEGAAQVPQVAELTGECENVKEFARLDERGRAQAIVRAFKAMAKTGCGTFIAGREGDGSSRMSWELEPEEIYAFATGAGEALVEVEVGTVPEQGPPARRGGRAARRPAVRRVRAHGVLP